MGAGTALIVAARPARATKNDNFMTGARCCRGEKNQKPNNKKETRRVSGCEYVPESVRKFTRESRRWYKNMNGIWTVKSRRN